MPVAVVAAVAAGAAIAKGVSAKKAAKKQSKALTEAAAMYGPNSVQARAAQLNPELYGALAGEKGTSGYQNSLYNIASNPGYIDPALMNAPYEQSAQRQQSDLLAAQGMLGRNQVGGGTGLGAAYALANQGARTGRDTQIGQQYALWREGQRRSDIDWLTQARNQAQSAALQGVAGQTNLLAQRPVGPSWLGVAADAASAGASAYGGMAGMAGGANMNGAGAPSGWGQDTPRVNPNKWQEYGTA